MEEKRLEDEVFKGQFKGQTLLRIFKLARSHWPWLVGFLVAVTLTALGDSINTYISRLIIDLGVLAGDKAALFKYGTMLAGLFVINSFNIFAFISCAGRLGEKLRFDIRKIVFEHLQTLSFSFFDRTSSGWLLSRITSDSQRVAQLVSWMLLDVVWATVNIIMALVFMLFMNVKLTLYIALVIPLLIGVAIYFRRKIIIQYRKVRSINSQITHAYSENIAGVKVVKALAREVRNLLKFKTMAGEMHAVSFRAGWLSALFLPLVQLITTLGVTAVLLAGGRQLSLGELSAGEIRAFIGYITFMMWPVFDLARVLSEMQQSIASAERVFTLLDTKPDIVDLPGAGMKARFNGRIEFRHVDFHYKQDAPVLVDFNLQVEPGEMIALVGATGSGKTTIVNLLARFYEPGSGLILFDGEDYRTYTQQALQSRIGVVLQHPHLFSGTVKENILYGRPEATASEVEAAAKLARAHEMILSLAAGYNESVGEGGNLLSVGQKQLISLARAFIANPDIIVMDEATSSIDTLTEHEIQAGMRELIRGRTSFVIAHRLSTIREANRILVIENGRIKEQGNHRELLQRKGQYYNLYISQMRTERQTAWEQSG